MLEEDEAEFLRFFYVSVAGESESEEAYFGIAALFAMKNNLYLSLLCLFSEVLPGFAATFLRFFDLLRGNFSFHLLKSSSQRSCEVRRKGT